MRKPNKLQRYGVLVRLTLREQLAHPRFVLPWIVVTVGVAAVTMSLYTTAYALKPQAALPLAGALWSVAIGGLLRISWRHITSAIAEDVYKGAIVVRARYPLSYIGIMIADHIGRTIPVIGAMPLLALFATIFAGVPHVPDALLSWTGGIALFLGGILLSMLMYISIGLAAFWLEDAEPLLWVVDKSIVVLGGSVIPLALLPAAPRFIIELTPLAATGFASRALAPDFSMVVVRLLCTQVGWVAVFTVVLWQLWSRAVRRLEVNGG